MKIREARLSDAPSLSRLALSLEKFYGDDDSSGISPYFAKKITVESFENYLKNKEAYEDYVYEKNEKIIGYFSLLNGIHFLYLLVDEKHHKQGVAKALITYALENRTDKFYSVNASIYAVPFYKKLGFVAFALVQKHHGMIYQPMIWDRDIKNKKGKIKWNYY